MKLLTRYLLGSHLGPFAFAFFALSGLILVNTVMRQLVELSGRGMPAGVIAEYFLLALFPVVAVTLPMAVLVAVLHTFSRLAADNEILALRASGVDVRRLVAPLLLCAALLAGGMLWFNDRVLPETNHRLIRLTMDVMRTRPLLAFRERALNPIETPEGVAYLQADRIEGGSGRLRDVAIFDVREPGVGRTIYADSGHMAMDAARGDLVLTLFDGRVRRLELARPDAFESSEFGHLVMRMPGVGSRLERSTGAVRRTDRDMSMAMMHARIDSLRAEGALLRRAMAGPRPPSAEPLAALREQARWLDTQVRELQVEIHKKLSLAAASLIFVLLGIPLALRFPHGGIGMVIAVSVPVFTLYHVGLRSGESLANAGYLSPVWAMWSVNVVLGAAGALGVLRLGRERGVGRGDV